MMLICTQIIKYIINLLMHVNTCKIILIAKLFFCELTLLVQVPVLKIRSLFNPTLQIKHRSSQADMSIDEVNERLWFLAGLPWAKLLSKNMNCEENIVSPNINFIGSLFFACLNIYFFNLIIFSRKYKLCYVVGTWKFPFLFFNNFLY